MSFTTKALTSSSNIEVKEAGGDSVVRETGDNPRVTWRFTIRGATDASDAYDALYSYLQTNFSDGSGGIASYDMPLDTIRVNTTDSNYFYEGEVSFAYPPPDEDQDDDINDVGYTQPNIDELDYSYNTTGGVSHLSYSLATLGRAGASLRDFGGGIGWNGNGFDGVDVITPHTEFSISVNWPAAFFTQAYRLALANATGCVNSATWHGFDAGCVLFKGVQASPKSFQVTLADGSTVKSYYWRAVYTFEANPATTVVFNGTTLVKRGFDYLWKLSEKTESANGDLQSQVVQVNVEQVYPEFDFANLLLPFPA